MKNKTSIAVLVITMMLFTFGVAYATTDWNDDNHFNGTVNWFKNGIRIGQQGTGGVTFFNGTIVNETTTDDVDNPVTFGDNVRIDGEIWRTEKGGDDPIKVSDTIIPTTTIAYSLGSESLRFKDGHFAGTVYSGGISTSSFVGSQVITNDSLTNGAVMTANMGDNIVTAQKMDYTNSHGYARAGAMIETSGGSASVQSSFNNVGGDISVTHGAGSGIYTISVPGVVAGDFVVVSLYDVTGGMVSALVSGSGQVTAYTWNNLGAIMDRDFEFVVY